MEINTEEQKQIIQNNFYRVLEKIDKAARKSGRNSEEIRLVVVTKTQPIDWISYVIEAGAVNLGENYVEDAIPKIQAFSDNRNIFWHMIGHLQSRKAENYCQYFQYLHSLDSVKLASRLSRFAQLNGKPIQSWLEFNISGEGSKSGWNIIDEQKWDAVLPALESVLNIPNINALGAMAVPPYSEDPEDSRLYYQKLKKFQEFVIKHVHPQNFQELSIGMSSDFEVAIQEGSTCVRIGQAIFGPRSK